MTYKIIISVVCIVFIIALLGKTLNKEEFTENFDTFDDGLIEIEEKNILYLNNEKICYADGSNHEIKDIEINEKREPTIETNPLSIVYLSNKHYDLTNICITSIFKVNNLETNPILFKSNNFSVEIIYENEKAFIHLNTNKESDHIDLEIKENEYYTYNLCITPSLISFKIKDNPNTDLEYTIYQEVDNYYCDKIYIGDNFFGYPFIKAHIIRNNVEEFNTHSTNQSIPEPDNEEEENYNKIKAEEKIEDLPENYHLIIELERMINNSYKIKWKHDKRIKNAYYVIVITDINNKGMILNLAIPTDDENYSYELKSSDIKYSENVITLRMYHNNHLLGLHSNKIIITK